MTGGWSAADPWRLIGRRVDAQATVRKVEFFVDGQLVRNHLRAASGRATNWADYPPEKTAFHLRTLSWYRTPAAEAGPA